MAFIEGVQATIETTFSMKGCCFVKIQYEPRLDAYNILRQQTKFWDTLVVQQGCNLDDFSIGTKIMCDVRTTKRGWVVSQLISVNGFFVKTKIKPTISYFNNGDDGYGQVIEYNALTKVGVIESITRSGEMTGKTASFSASLAPIGLQRSGDIRVGQFFYFRIGRNEANNCSAILLQHWLEKDLLRTG